ncbi:hypothetical protein GLYMA_19G022400v4 [Glycine max]|nr:hypothetical protein GLYMA_19G022400v4 [Glycine max]KAH1076066.1 hypothetical protein GYH30_051796 [Glycine max]
MQTCCQLWFQDMKPHFALGRNRELQGLARAMVKRWETSAIQKLPSNELFLIHPIADAYGLLMHRNGPLHLEFPLHQEQQMVIQEGQLWWWRLSNRIKGSNYGDMEEKGRTMVAVSDRGSMEGTLGIFELRKCSSKQ